ncbi:MAG: DNA repair protein RecN [Anaerolineae bacterium]|nr:DNA repair protein RecN [Anaerolineae bacterium]
MLAELTITNFAIIEKLHLDFSHGFNVFTGETGAGKSIIIDAVSLLLGGRADSQVIRAGTRKSTIEGIFYLTAGEHAALDPLLEQEALQNDDADVLILAREIRASGHNVCRVNGRAVRLAILEQFGSQLVDIHGQSEHLSLLNERAHLDFLDRYGGLEAERAVLSERVRALRVVRRELNDLIRNEREMQQRADLLRYQVNEIRTAQLQVGETEELENELNRLVNAEKLTALSGEALQILSDGQDEQASVTDLLGQASRILSNLARVDPQMEAKQQQIEEVGYQLDDLAAALSDYQEAVEFNPVRLEQVEERLTLIRRLQRKYGDSVQDLLDFAQHAAEELDTIEHSGERIAELEVEQSALLREIGVAGAVLSHRRREAGARLSAMVEAELDELKMEQARFAVEIQWQQQEGGAVVDNPLPDSECAPGQYSFDSNGLDRVAFLIAPNVGEPLKPLARVASGGETSRLMLALKAALAAADHIPTLIFDEIDQGIGGRIGGVVGRKLWNLSKPENGGHQVFCVTHLPQLAGCGDTHLYVDKIVQGERTMTVVNSLEGEARITEMAHMLGGDSEKTREIARELLKRNERPAELTKEVP